MLFRWPNVRVRYARSSARGPSSRREVHAEYAFLRERVQRTTACVDASAPAQYAHLVTNLKQQQLDHGAHQPPLPQRTAPCSSASAHDIVVNGAHRKANGDQAHEPGDGAAPSLHVARVRATRAGVRARDVPVRLKSCSDSDIILLSLAPRLSFLALRARSITRGLRRAQEVVHR